MAKKCKVNQDACIGCGLCAGMYAAVFALNDEGKATVIGSDDAAFDDAASNCPVAAIEVED